MCNLSGSREDDLADVTQAQLIEELARGLRISAHEWKLDFADQGAGILSATVAGCAALMWNISGATTA
jgi:hypothetical protein